MKCDRCPDEGVNDFGGEWLCDVCYDSDACCNTKRGIPDPDANTDNWVIIGGPDGSLHTYREKDDNA